MTHPKRRSAPLLAAALLAAPWAALSPAHADTAADSLFLFRLGMLEGHLIIGHDLVRAGHADLAIPHFGHPVRELYDDIGEYVSDHHVRPFDTQLIKLEAAVASDPASPATEALYQQTIATIHAARDAAPAAVRNSVPEMIKVCAETVDAAAGEYGEALDRGRIDVIVEYHDSRGYVSYADEAVKSLAATHPDAADQSMLHRFEGILAQARWIVDPLIPPPTPRASVGQYRTVASEAAAIVPQAPTR